MSKTNKKAYKRHAYSGPRKSLKKVRAGLRQFYGEVSRSEVWRSDEKMKKPVNEEIVINNFIGFSEVWLSEEKMKKPVKEEIVINNCIGTEDKQPRTYARKQKIGLETTYSDPGTSTSTVKDEPLEINWPQAGPEMDPFQLKVRSVTKNRLSRISAYHIVHCQPETCDTIDIEAKSPENSFD